MPGPPRRENESAPVDRFQRRAFPVDADPVICELQMLSRRHGRHVATDAVAGADSGSQCGMGFPAMAAGALAVIKDGVVPAQRIVRIVAGEAGKPTVALTKTRALGQIQRLMPGIPGVIPVRCRFALLRFAVT